MKFNRFIIFIALTILSVLCLNPSLGIGQEQSSTKWGEIKLNNFLSFRDWKDQSDERDLAPGWETIIKERNHREIVGRFFQCVGICRIDRGVSFFNPNFKTAIYEGDEVKTVGESYAWIFLFDGTMVRLSPESSINFNELNIGIKENFLNARVNAGNILWLSRNELLLEEINARETDVLFNPLILREAIPVPDKKKYDEDDLVEMLTERQTILNQYKNLNNLIENNNKFTRGKPTYAFIVAPNITIMGPNPSVEIVSLLGGKTYLKSRSLATLGIKKDLAKDIAAEEIYTQMRGFENADLTKLESDVWQEVDEKGRSIIPETNNLNWLLVGEFITKRIPSLLVARELMLTEYSQFAFIEKYDPNLLAKNFGYRLWGSIKSGPDTKKDDLELRLDFLKEYFRRIETTNLSSSTHFSERLRERGESLKVMDYSNFFFIKALDTYYSYEDYNDEMDMKEVLNSTTKTIWKRMHGIR